MGNKFALAGQTWKVVEINFQKKIVMVKKAAGKASSFWRGGTGIIHTRILQKMQQVLRENTQYPYLQKNAIKRLQIARELARDWELTEKNIIRLAGNKCCIFPWIGTKAFRTLERLINFFGRESLQIKNIDGINPYFLMIELDGDKIQYLYPEIISLCQKITAKDLLSNAEAPKIQKYDEFIPALLLQKAFASDYLDMEELRQQVRNWQSG